MFSKEGFNFSSLIAILKILLHKIGYLPLEWLIFVTLQIFFMQTATQHTKVEKK